MSKYIRSLTNRFSGRRTAIWFAFSYIAVFFIPILCSIFVLVDARQRIEMEYTETNNSILTNSISTVENSLSNAYSLSFSLGIEKNIEKLLYIQKPFTNQMRYDIAYAVMHEMGTKKFDATISRYMIYFSLGDFFLVTNAQYSAEAAHRYFFEDLGVSYSEWMGLLKEPQHKSIYSFGSDLYFFQDLPVQYPSNSPATSIVQISKEKIVDQLNKIDWINRGHFMILNDTGETILTNSEVPFSSMNFNSDNNVIVEGEKTIYSQQKDSRGWSYLLVLNPQDYKESMVAIDRIYLILFVLSIIVGLWLVIVFTLRNSRPIKNIVSLFDRYNVDTIPMSNNDIAYIRNSVEHIIKQNKNMESEVIAKNELIKQNFLGRILSDSVFLSKISPEQLKENGLKLDHELIRLACFSIREYSNYYENTDYDDEEFPVDNLYFDLLNTIKEQMNSSYITYVCESEGTIMALLNYDSNSQKADLYHKVIDVQNFIEEKLSIRTEAFLSNDHHSIYALQDAIIEVQTVMQQASREHADSSNFHVYENKQESADYIYTTEMEQAFYNNLLLGNADMAKNIMTELFENKYTEHSTPYVLFKAYIMDIAITFIQAAESTGLKLEECSAIRVTEQVSKINTSHEALHYFDTKIDLLCNTLNESKTSHNTDLYENILSYIADNYRDMNLDNTMIADAMHISPAYLSRFFKQQSGIVLSRYISSLRVEKAKEILTENKDITISDVAICVGIENTATFIRIFKRHEGITPGRYASLEH